MYLGTVSQAGNYIKQSWERNIMYALETVSISHEKKTRTRDMWHDVSSHFTSAEYGAERSTASHCPYMEGHIVVTTTSLIKV